MKIKLTKDNWSNVCVGDKMYMSICNNCKYGKEAIVTSWNPEFLSLDNCTHGVTEIRKNDYYIPVLPTLETLDVGDEVVDSKGYERRILMAQGEGEYRCYMLSSRYNKRTTGTFYTAHELKEQDQEQPRELTIDEIAEKFGMKAEDVRIKKEAE